MVPDVPPSALASRWDTWEALQANGEYAYRALPTANVSQDRAAARGAVDVFRLDGEILDVGCGPLTTVSAYAVELRERYIGLDPMLGEQPREFRFVNGIAEALPFPAHSFDAIIFYSSLDHVLDVEQALREAQRVLRPGGSINIWMDQATPEQGPLVRFADLVRRGIKQTRAAVSHLGPARGLAYVWHLATMHIPNDAADPFHMRFPTPEEVQDALADYGFRDIRHRNLGDEVAFSMVLG